MFVSVRCAYTNGEICGRRGGVVGSRGNGIICGLCVCYIEIESENERMCRVYTPHSHELTSRMLAPNVHVVYFIVMTQGNIGLCKFVACTLRCVFVCVVACTSLYFAARHCGFKWKYNLIVFFLSGICTVKCPRGYGEYCELCQWNMTCLLSCN